MIEVEQEILGLYQACVHVTKPLTDLKQISEAWNVVVNALDEMEVTLNESDVDTSTLTKLYEVRQKAQRLARMHR